MQLRCEIIRPGIIGGYKEAVLSGGGVCSIENLELYFFMLIMLENKLRKSNQEVEDIMIK